MKGYFLYCLLTLVASFQVMAQPGNILETGDQVLDPNADGFVSVTNSGFLGDGYDPDEFEIKMFGVPIFGDGEALGDVNSGAACGVSDLSLDSAGYAVYAAYDAGENLIFRFRTAGNKPSVQSYSIIIDSDDRVGPDDPNSISENPGFEIEITLIHNFGVFIYDIDGIDTCPDPLASYSVDTHQQKSTSSEMSCDDEDFFVDFYVPFGDLEQLFGITPDSPLKFVGVTNISATCFLGGSISDIGGIDDRDYNGCLECAILDLANNSCPATVSNLCDTCAGFPEGVTQTPEINKPVIVGDNTIDGTAEENALIYIDIFNASDQLIDQDTTTADANGFWISNTLLQPLTFEDSVVVNALVPGKCQSGLNNIGLSFAIVSPNQTPVIVGDLTTIGYIENSLPIVIDNTINIDDDNTNMLSATVQITGNYQEGLDQLGFGAVTGIVGSFDSATGSLQFSGDAPLSDYETLLQSVTFVHLGDFPDLNIRTVSFTVSDNLDTSSPFNKNILISPENDPPVITQNGNPVDTLYFYTEEETAISICLVVSDVEQDAVDFSDYFIENSQSTVERVPNELCLIYTPYEEFSGIEYLQASLCDNGLPQACSSVVIVLSVTPVNDPPTTIEEGLPADTVTFKIAWNTSLQECLETFDVEGNTVVIDNIILNEGSGSINSTFGTTCLSYTPDPNVIGEAWATATLCDDGDPPKCIETVIKVVITESNLAPVVVKDTVFVDVLQNQTATICIVATDINGDDITLSIVDQGVPGSTISFDQNLLCIDYTPAVNYFGQDFVTLQACDDFSPPLCDNVVLAVEVAPFNNPPAVVENDIPVDTVYLETIVNVPLPFCLETIDLDMDNVILQAITSNTQNGVTVQDQDFCFEFTSNQDFVGTESVTIDFCDDRNPVACNQVVLMVEVFPENRPPEIQLNGQPIDTLFLFTEQNVNLDFCLEVFDYENDPVALESIEEVASGGFLLPGSLTTCFTFIPNPDFLGTDIRKLTICDNGSPQGCDEVVVVTTIVPVNNAPSILWNGVPSDTISFTMNKNESLEICLELVDPDNDELTITKFDIVVGEGNLTQPDPLTYCATYDPPLGYFGNTWILTEVCDSGIPEKCDNAVIGIEILDFNLAPVAKNDTINTKEDVSVSGNFLLNDSDPDGDSLILNTISLVLPLNGVLQIQPNGDFTYTPSLDFFGTDSIRYTVCDVRSDQLCGEATAFIRIEPQPDPVIAYEAVSPNEDGYNDFWFIKNIEEYPNNVVRVFDRWNNLVYQVTGYNNLNVKWTGESNRGISNSNVGSGTYFFTIELNNGSPIVSGMVVLKR